MRHALSTVCLIAIAVGCSDATPPTTTQGAKAVAYTEFIVDVHSHSINRVDTDASQLRAVPNSRFDIFEVIHLIYVFQFAGLMAVSYDGDGKLTRISARHDANATFWYPTLGSDSPFAAYKLCLAGAGRERVKLFPQ